jgi:hypothetical protein
LRFVAIVAVITLIAEIDVTGVALRNQATKRHPGAEPLMRETFDD